MEEEEEEGCCWVLGRLSGGRQGRAIVGGECTLL